MEIELVDLGKAKGIRLSKIILDKYNIKDKVELRLEKEQIVLKSVTYPRKGWDKAFKSMHENGDDKLLIDDVFENEAFEEWN